MMETQLVLAVLGALLMRFGSGCTGGFADAVGSGCTGGFANAVFFVPDTTAVPGPPSLSSVSLSSFLFLFSITFSSYSHG